MKKIVVVSIILAMVAMLAWALPKDDVLWITRMVSQGKEVYQIVVPTLEVKEQYNDPVEAVNNVFSKRKALDRSILDVKKQIATLSQKAKTLEMQREIYNALADAEKITLDAASLFYRGDEWFFTEKYGKIKEVAISKSPSGKYQISFGWSKMHKD